MTQTRGRGISGPQVPDHCRPGPEAGLRSETDELHNLGALARRARRDSWNRLDHKDESLRAPALRA